MKTMQQILSSTVMVAIAGCAALALLGSCSQDTSSQPAQQSAPAASSAAYSATGAKLATQEEWQFLQDKIAEAAAYTDLAPYTEESWELLEQAKHMANRAMMGYPDKTSGDVKAAAQQLVSAMMTLQLKS